MNTAQNPTPPAQVRSAALIAAVQSLVGIAYAVLLVVREIMGKKDAAIVYEGANAHTAVGLGTGVFFIVVFGTVMLAAWRMSQGKRWGRGPVLMLELLLVPITIYMVQGGAWMLAIPTGLSALAGLAMLFSAPAVEWASARFRE